MSWIETVSAFGAMVAAAIAAYAAVQSKRASSFSASAASANLLLDIDTKLNSESVHLKLYGDGIYTKPNAKVREEDWQAIIEYMGLFERIEYMIEKNLLEEDVARRFYCYRVRALCEGIGVAQQRVEKDGRERWESFIKIANRWGIDI